jgi:hypothetical protein
LVTISDSQTRWYFFGADKRKMKRLLRFKWIFARLRPAVRRTGKWSEGGETQERSRSETTVGEPQAEARRTFGAVLMPLVTSALFAERNRHGREGNRADHQPV